MDTVGDQRETRAPGAWAGRLLVLGLLLVFCPAAVGAEAKVPNAFAETNMMHITSTNGSEISPSAWVSRGDVRVLDSRMYLECDLLTVLLQTNSSARHVRTGPPTESGSLTNVDIDRIVAETNVLIMTREVTLIGDRAVYTQSNEVLVVTGVLVIAETERSYTFAERFDFDLRSSKGSVVGPTYSMFKVDAVGDGLQSPGLGPKPRGRPGAPPEPPKK